jgi:hypothetical protein
MTKPMKKPRLSKPSVHSFQGQATVAALRQLAPADKTGSFEELITRLLAKLIGQPVRRTRAGSQEGKDALSDDGTLAIECKRYAEGTSLSARHLISELEEAKARHPDLQLWILAATTALGATEKEKLDHAAHSKGLAVLHLDTAATGPYLDSTHAIAALCATDVETTLELLPGGARRKVRTELETIRSDPNFAAWEEWLHEEVRNRLPFWRFAVKRSNLALRTRILETADTTFGTRYAADKAVPREARAQLKEWFDRVLTSQSPDVLPVAVVLGERYDGKTWLVYQWLSRSPSARLCRSSSWTQPAACSQIAASPSYSSKTSALRSDESGPTRKLSSTTTAAGTQEGLPGR